MKGTFDVQKSRFRVWVDQMLFDFDFGPVHRLTGVTAAGRSRRQWRFRFIGRSRKLMVYSDVANGATTNTVVDSTVTASNAIATAVDATVTAGNGDAAATTGDANATADDATATAGDPTAIAVDAIATFRHRL